MSFLKDLKKSGIGWRFIHHDLSDSMFLRNCDLPSHYSVEVVWMRPQLALDAWKESFVPPLRHGVDMNELVLLSDLLLKLRFVYVFRLIWSLF